MKTNPNDPATGFFSTECGTAHGLSKREYMALHLAAAYMGADYVGNSGVSAEEIAERGVQAADALIAQLNREETSTTN